ncbi:MAG: Rrf2 family transcriptional regulator [Megasphaera sp.]|jgi:Rrf2 family protein|uniref:RrF2 family transcriptional regulator n=1 Tax=Megasphaera sueciensis TaxID=349094 RepID=UPI003D06917E|nr:Rrf2 family transcriptional regulator [Megasphaera sp.]MCI1822335.1 Rrf2 family transcriptional regulator [Megasphaera sp.]
MKLNQATDYAFRLILYFSTLPEGTKVSATELSQNQHIPKRFLLKIMRNLILAGIIKSYRGVDGGFSLQRKPSAITLFDIIAAVEGEPELLRCLPNMENCTRDCAGMCAVYDVFREIQQELIQHLQRIDFEFLEKQEHTTDIRV